MTIDLNGAGPQRDEFALIPDGTIVPVQMTIRPGNAGDGGWLKRSNNVDTPCLMIDAEFIILEGEYAKRKFWSLLTVDGTTDGHKKAAEISISRIRAMLESAYGIKPSDDSAEAVAKRRINTFGDLDGLRFWAVLGVESGKDGYKDKNVLKAVITPERTEWRLLPQVAKPVGTMAPVGIAAQAVVNAARPSWA